MKLQEELMFKVIDAIDRFGTLKYGAGDYDEKYTKEEWQMKAHAVRQEIHVLLIDLNKENVKAGLQIAADECLQFANMYNHLACNGDRSGASDHKEVAALEINEAILELKQEI